jgi:Leucine-rich repeat (LRR) protein
MELTTEKIHKEYLKGNLDKQSAAKLLFSIIENSESDKIRVESIKELEHLRMEDKRTFKFLENLLISDLSERVRNSAADVMKNLYLEQALEPMKWALAHEQSPGCLENIYESLFLIIQNYAKRNTSLMRDQLLGEVKKIRNKEFKIGFELICENQSVNSLSNTDLAEIIITYFTLVLLEKIYWRLKYKTKNCRIMELDFIFKGLTKLPASIKNLTSLKVLILRYNQLTTLPEWIGSLKSLERLNLNINNLTSLPESIGNLKSLKELLLWKNELKYLPESIGELSNLEKLNLRLNQLDSLPHSIGKLSSLKELNLHDNKIIELPEEFGNLQSLDNLNLSWNYLKKLPFSIGQIFSLKTLDLEKNELEYLPNSIGSLINLQILNLSDNKIKTLPPSIGNLTSLKVLNLYRNNLEELPIAINSLSSLKELHIGENYCCNIIDSFKVLEDRGVKIYL